MKTCLRCNTLFYNPKNKKFCSPECSRFITDELSPFRWFMKRIKANCHSRNIRTKTKNKVIVDPNLSIYDLKEIWDKQNGICPFTGWKLKFNKNTNWKNQLSVTVDKASIDRIDSNNNYTKNNIRFVSYIAQMAKNIFSNDELINFCRCVSNHNKEII